jgi:hypothetical protein
MRGERFFMQSRTFLRVFSFVYSHSLHRHGSVGGAYRVEREAIGRACGKHGVSR